MKIIQNRHPLTECIQTNKKGKIHKNKYNVCVEIDDGLLIFNTLSLSLVFLTKMTKKEWEEGKIDENKIGILKQELFILNDDLDESKANEQIKEIVKAIYKTKKI